MLTGALLAARRATESLSRNARVDAPSRPSSDGMPASEPSASAATPAQPELPPAAHEALRVCRDAASDAYGRGCAAAASVRGACVDAASDARSATWVAGNCAQYTSSGVEFAGLLRRSRLFPKAILIELLESEHRQGRSHNCRARPQPCAPRGPCAPLARRAVASRPTQLRWRSHADVVVYQKVAHAPPYLPKYRFCRPAYVHPLNPIRNVVYSDMHPFADVTVEVAPGTTRAVPRRTPPERVRRPPRWMPLWRGFVLGAPSVVLIGLVDHIGPVGPAGATVWLVLNWWLY